MSGASPSALLRLALLAATLLVAGAFAASVLWLLRTHGARQHETYLLARVNASWRAPEAAPPERAQDLVQMEIAMRRVEENSRRLKEYTRSLLWDNKDKSLWCVLFKESGRPRPARGGRRSLDEGYIRVLRQQKMREAVIHLRHHGGHHRRRLDAPPMPYIK